MFDFQIYRFGSTTTTAQHWYELHQLHQLHHLHVPTIHIYTTILNDHVHTTYNLPWIELIRELPFFCVRITWFDECFMHTHKCGIITPQELHCVRCHSHQCMLASVQHILVCLLVRYAQRWCCSAATYESAWWSENCWEESVQGT